MTLVSCSRQTGDNGQAGPAQISTSRACNVGTFVPNYATEVNAVGTVRWDHFPLKLWIDLSTVQNASELTDLQTGLSAWSKATGGVLGISFTTNEQAAEILVRMVDGDKLTGANGKTVYGITDHGYIRLATIEIVHSSWLGSPQIQYRSRTVQRDAAHEMGHALGIAGHTTTPGAIMRANASVDSPTISDLNTIKTKYCQLF
jgi:predicted Zn-dependent protease